MAGFRIGAHDVARLHFGAVAAFLRWGWWTGALRHAPDDPHPFCADGRERRQACTWVAGVLPDLTDLRAAAHGTGAEGFAVGHVVAPATGAGLALAAAAIRHRRHAEPVWPAIGPDDAAPRRDLDAFQPAPNHVARRAIDAVEAQRLCATLQSRARQPASA